MNRAVGLLSIGGVALVLGAAAVARAVVTDEEALALAAAVDAGGAIEHCDEAVESGDFLDIFDCGDELFETRFNANDGVGMDVGDGGRFTRVPRADQDNFRNSIPARETGPNGEACNLCHFDGAPAGDGAAPAALNHIRDPLLSGDPGQFIQREPPHIFGPGGVQLLAEEMTEDLQGIAAQAQAQACDSGEPVPAQLLTKGVSFGSIVASCQSFDLTQIEGIDADLVVKPFEWKGVERTVRTFSRSAFHMELGMQPVELTGDGVDGDFDGVTDEISIADVSAMAVYLAAQPRPVSLIELDNLRRILTLFGDPGNDVAADLGLPTLSFDQRVAIFLGAFAFNQIGCADCHRPSLQTRGVIFSEPSQNPNFRDDIFPAGQDAVSRGVDPDNPLTFDITQDPPDNIIMVGDVEVTRLGAFQTGPDGGAVIRLFSDLKRHDLGPGIAENIDAPPCNCGPSVFLTEALWGVGGTAPYLHDGRATTLTEAILEHGGEAAESRANFLELSPTQQANLISFLNNLVLFFPAEEEE